VDILVACILYPVRECPVLFPQLYSKCRGKTPKNRARSTLLQISYYFCCSVVICVVLVPFVCKCVL